LWLSDLDYRSELSGSSWNLNINYYARGVLEKSAKPTRAEKLGSGKAEEIRLLYPKTRFSKAHKTVREVINGNLGTSKLEDTADLLETILREQFK